MQQASPSRIGVPSSTARAASSRLLRRWWWFRQLRRVQHEGVARAWRRRRLWNRVLRSPAVRTAPIGRTSPFELHLLCCLADYVSAVWALKSLLRRFPEPVPLYLHLQGHSTSRMRTTLRQHFPDAALVTQRSADAHVASVLERPQFPRLHALRDRSPIMLKLVDVALFGRAGRILLLDSDVLFFRRPDELLTAAHEPGRAVFQRDVDSCYVISAAEARELGVDLRPALNSGVVVIDRGAIDLALCERFLAHDAFNTSSGWVEQTLYALLACASGEPNVLPPTYAISATEAPAPGTLVARHYSGVSRPYLTSQGIPWLLEEGCILSGGPFRGHAERCFS